jgi:hypothetical protein
MSDETDDVNPEDPRPLWVITPASRQRMPLGPRRELGQTISSGST